MTFDSSVPSGDDLAAGPSADPEPSLPVSDEAVGAVGAAEIPPDDVDDEPDDVDADAADTFDEDTPRARRRPSPAVAFVAGALLGLVGVVTLLLSVTGLVHSSSLPPKPSPAIVAPAAVTPVDLAHGRTLGSATAPVKVEIWEDFQCPICARWNATVKGQLLSTYVRPGKVQVTYRDFIVIGQESILASIAARVAEREGAFWPYADQLFANQIGENAGSFTARRLVAMSAAAHLDWQTFQTALLDGLEDRAMIQSLQESQSEAKQLGLSGTPSIVVDGTVLANNDWPTVSAAIDKALAAK